MLFTSWVFLFTFLPLALLGFELAGRIRSKAAAAWLVLVSLAFYGFWQPGLIVLISVSMLFNYGVASLIRRHEDKERHQNLLLWLGIAVNLVALFYYKYAFAILSFLGSQGLVDSKGIPAIVLPLGISFFTFTQIGYLVDCKQKVTRENGFLNYLLFVTFFPHLIAGPILHNGEIMPQFADQGRFRLKAENVSAGLTLFIIGLLKKSLIADSLAGLNNFNFAFVNDLNLYTGWLTALGYSMQLYFDFSGYSDMAIGLALLFNIRFPPNFNSPYKAGSIIDFWQRFHMSLTRYITLYVYNPVAVSLGRRRMSKGLPMGKRALKKPGPFLALVALPLFITMALAGVWHGAGLQFLVYGLLHAGYLTINHLWRMFEPRHEPAAEPALMRWLTNAAQVLLTYLAVVVAQVFFRAASVSDGVSVIAAMIGLKGTRANPLIDMPASQFALIAGCFALVWLFPNSQQIMANASPVLGKIDAMHEIFPRWRPTVAWAAVASLGALIALLSIGGTHEFLYFRF